MVRSLADSLESVSQLGNGPLAALEAVQPPMRNSRYTCGVAWSLERLVKQPKPKYLQEPQATCQRVDYARQRKGSSGGPSLGGVTLSRSEAETQNLWFTCEVL